MGRFAKLFGSLLVFDRGWSDGYRRRRRLLPIQKQRPARPSWTHPVFRFPARLTGNAMSRKAGGKDEIAIWTTGTMVAGSSAALPVTAVGDIEPSTACGTVLSLPGSWSSGPDPCSPI